MSLLNGDYNNGNGIVTGVGCSGKGLATVTEQLMMGKYKLRHKDSVKPKVVSG